MIAKTPATTPTERSVRISALAAEADRDALHGLLELGARRAQELNGMATSPEMSASVLRLAAAISSTFEPEVPAFEVDEPVSLAECDPADAQLLGRIDQRYLNERGEWEYHVRLKGSGPMFATYTEGDLAPFDN